MKIGHDQLGCTFLNSIHYVELHYTLSYNNIHLKLRQNMFDISKIY